MDQILIWACVVSLFLNFYRAKSSDNGEEHHKHVSTNQILMFGGYFVIGLLIVCSLVLWLFKRWKSKEQINHLDDSADNSCKQGAADHGPSFSTVELKAGGGQISKTTTDSGDETAMVISSPLIVLSSPEEEDEEVVNGLNFEELLKAPAELVGRGTHGSVYKVAWAGMDLGVKRIKDWSISSAELKRRMRRLNQAKHPHVLPVIAFYSSKLEKLIVYEYQPNGSLFTLIHAHGNERKQAFDWSSRISVAVTLAHSLAFMHEELENERIPHGNLKSSNVLLNSKMEPCISEYGLMLNLPSSRMEGFKEDTYAFGVILLELLTGREVLSEGVDLASWVLAVVREEWTVEVFDKMLIRQAASEERMVNMLQVATKCVKKSPEARPGMREVASMISMIKEEEEKSTDVSELLSFSRSFVDL